MAELSVKRIANGRTIRSLLMAAVLLVVPLEQRYFIGTIAVISISTSMPGHAS